MKYDYDVIVLGGGAAGLTSAGLAASFGAKTALIEARKLGGDCTWYGCVPSKALLQAAKISHLFNSSEKYGIVGQKSEINIEKVLSKVHSIQNHIYNDADHPDIYKKLGIEVINAKGKFLDRNKILITNQDDNSEKIISGKFIFISTGSSPFIPPIKGISEIDYLTNENIFSIKELPKELLVVGGGPIGCEMAQAFLRLGSKVSIVDISDRILNNDDSEHSEILKKSLEEEGITFHLKTVVEEFIKDGNKIKVKLTKEGKSTFYQFDKVLISSGRKPNIMNLDVEKVGIKFTNKGIITDQSGRTNIKNIFAVGDCAGSFQFTHYAEHMAKKTMSTALLKIPFKFEPQNIVWSTYTDPEVAHVGLTRVELEKKKIKYKIYRFPFAKIDRAITESNSNGWIKVYAKEFNGKIYGVDIVGTNAGEMINEFALAIKNNISLRKIADTIHAYPTYMLGNRRVADQWYVQKQSRTFVKILKMLFGYRGNLPDLSERGRIV